MKTEYFGSCEADYKALQFLLMRRKISGFDAEEAVAAVAEHIFVLRIPRHWVRVGLLVREWSIMEMARYEVKVDPFNIAQVDLSQVFWVLFYLR